MNQTASLCSRYFLLATLLFQFPRLPVHFFRTPCAPPLFPPQICTTKTAWSHQRSFWSEGICLEFDHFWTGRLVSGDLQGSSVSLSKGRSDQLFPVQWRLCFSDQTSKIPEVNCRPLTIMRCFFFFLHNLI